MTVLSGGTPSECKHFCDEGTSCKRRMRFSNKGVGFRV